MLNHELQVKERLAVEKEVAVAEVPPASVAVEESLVRNGLTVCTLFGKRRLVD